MQSHVNRMTETADPLDGLDAAEPYAESGTVQIEGRTFEAGGAYVSPDLIVAYLQPIPDRPGAYRVTTWAGEYLGNARCTSSWRRDSRYGPYRMEAITARIGGRNWHGRYGSDWAQMIRLRPTARRALPQT